MKNRLLYLYLLLTCSMTACNTQTESIADDTHSNPTTPIMKSHISLFEIPATDISRAVDFYQAILGITIEKMEMDGMEMGIFPYEEHLVTGVIMKADGYKPSANGVTIYLDGGDNLQKILDKVEENGGKIVVQKTAHADENGFFALFIDTEGNKLGLNSPN
ncbi:hypothetical protein CLV98_10794 [Dyadobacter jejuensis]|uniref:VOC domain-containing protein n=1 Tax=Dyadobacter jejuensis TaxID=1082580 RepID=A0A316B477_9BACT|nr:VOC family protein [Dyadobacter jejuensis]PWJ57387.1 hypothetical protein CLV98_10794 [Dyadobacter jejuensis]